jgi:hypothetical protein
MNLFGGQVSTAIYSGEERRRRDSGGRRTMALLLC